MREVTVIVGGLAELVGRFKLTLSVILHHLQTIVVGLGVAVENAATFGYMSCFCKGVVGSEMLSTSATIFGPEARQMEI
jgi:hypothetical protein